MAPQLACAVAYVHFLREHVDAGAREIVEAAGLVEIQVREHDVAHVVGAEAHRFDLAHRRHLGAQVRCEQAARSGREAPLGIHDIAHAQARIDEQQAFAGFDREAMAHAAPAREHAARGAIDEPPAEGTRADCS